MVYNTVERCTRLYTHHFDELEVYSAVMGLGVEESEARFVALGNGANMNKQCCTFCLKLTRYQCPLKGSFGH
jgi:hypothetical protein